MIKRILFAGALLAAPLGAVAQDEPPQYIGISAGGFELTDVDDNVTEITNVGLRGGYKFGRFFGVEVRGGWESGDVSGALDSPDLTYAGVFARADLPFERANVFLLAGGASVRYQGPQDTEVESDVAAGLGIELYGNERTAVTLDYMNYVDGTYEGVSLGLVHHFDWPRLR